MPTVEVLYCRTRHWTTPILRTVMWSPWSHEGLIMGDELGKHVIDATFTHGVARRDLDEILTTCSKYEIRKIWCPRPSLAYSFARRQLGKKYDTWGAGGLALHRTWQQDDIWFCSELVEACLVAGGNRRFEHYADRVTPQHSWMVTAEKVPTST